MPPLLNHVLNLVILKKKKITSSSAKNNNINNEITLLHCFRHVNDCKMYYINKCF